MKLNIETNQKITSLLLQRNNIYYFSDSSKKGENLQAPSPLPYECILKNLASDRGEFEIRFNKLHYNGHFILLKKENKIQFVMDGYFFEGKLIEESFLQQSLGKGNRISAQLPGKIIRLNVKVGDIVKKGQVLLVQEAMKMEHSIKATSDRKIKEIFVNEKDQVKEDQILLTFEEDP